MRTTQTHAVDIWASVLPPLVGLPWWPNDLRGMTNLPLGVASNTDLTPALCVHSDLWQLTFFVVVVLKGKPNTLNSPRIFDRPYSGPNLESNVHILERSTCSWKLCTEDQKHKITVKLGLYVHGLVRTERRNIGFEWEERKRRRRREEKEKKVTRAGIEPTAAAPSQPTRLDVSRSDHSAASRTLGYYVLSLSITDIANQKTCTFFR